MSNSKLNSYNKILKKYWNYDSLKDEQFKIIYKIIEEKKDVSAILATGFGKSICYQLPFLITKKSVIVISPLIALMAEQSLEMANKNIPVVVFNSESSSKKKLEDKTDILKGNNKLIFMTPEYFIKNENFIKNIEDQLLMVCIDEAHAISTWGLDFRSSYTKLSVIREWIPDIPILTLTATASTKVREDISNILNLSDPELIIGNFDRPNLLIRVLPRGDDVVTNILNLLYKYKDEYAIIYCKTRDETDLLTQKISAIGIKCDSYHAGMSDKARAKSQQDFIDGTTKCIVATIAFGMGINITNVRLVIHFNCPKNIESYYQEIGRAGRDGNPSECVLFFSLKDFKTNRYFLQSISNPIQKVYQEDQIKQIEKYVYSNECRRKVILQNFGQYINSCTNCDNCINTINNKKKNIIYFDYTKPVYLIFTVLSKINDKFGSGMIINILLGKKSKVKSWMINYPEYGSGICFGNIDWWKSLIRDLIIDGLLEENQVTKAFYTTTSFTKKGLILKNKLLNLFPNYRDLLIAAENNDEDYSDISIKYEEIPNTSKTKTPKIPKIPKTLKTIKNDIIKENNKTNKSTTNTKIIKNKITNIELSDDENYKDNYIVSDTNEIELDMSDSDQSDNGKIDYELEELIKKTSSFISNKYKNILDD